MKNHKLVQCHIPIALHRRARRAATASGVTVAAWVRQLLMRTLEVDVLPAPTPTPTAPEEAKT